MFDAIIVGARVAGSATGMLLARQGHSVLIVDRAEFPSDTWSTHFVTSAGTALLQRWGLIEPLKAKGVPVYDTILAHTPDTTMSVKGVFGAADVCSPRRTDLDLTLQEQAHASGAELRLGVTVTGLMRDDAGRVNGVRLRDGDGVESDEHARVVIGADGRTSIVAKTVEPAERDRHQMHGAAVFAYFDDLDIESPEAAFFDGTFMFIFPTKERSACVGSAFNAKYEDETKADPDAVFWRNLANVPDWVERVKRATRDGRWRLGELREGWFRHAQGPGWALVGDAAFLKDPLTGHGITDSFFGAELLSAAIHAAITAGGEPADVDAALARYDEALWRDLRPVYEANRDMATYDYVGGDMFNDFANVAILIGGELELVKAGGPFLDPPE